MKVLVAHNFYQQPGGEDQVFHSELALLESHGLKPLRFEMHNDDVSEMGRLSMLRVTIWNRSAARKIGDVVRENKIDVVHFHNTFPLMSPASYYAVRKAGAAVVQTLHNFRFLCAGANFFRDGKVCETCLNKKIPLAGIRHRCYRNDTAASAAVVGMLATHRVMGTYDNAVDAYITPTRFARDKFIQGGLPGDRIIVKPNFVHPDPGIGAGGGGYAIFVGRLSHEKGLDTLLAAWQKCTDVMPLKIVGDGPLADQVREAVASNKAIEWVGRKSMDEVFDLIGNAELLVFPSECYETFGRTAVEAYAKGTPVIASGHGAPADVVEDGRTGLLFKPSDADDLAAKVRQMMSDASLRNRMRAEVRNEYLSKYSGEKNFEMLMSVYHFARAGHGYEPADATSRTAGVAPVSVARG